MNAASAIQYHRSYPSGPPVRVVDWFMLLLAVVSVGYLLWITFWNVAPDTERLIFHIDYVVCGIFALEFLWRWRKARWKWNYPFAYWYDIIGMIPVSSPIFRGFRLIRVVVVLARLGRVADRVYGERITAALVTRFTKTIVETIKRPITVAMLDEVTDVLKTGHYTRNIAAALDENRSELNDMMLEMILKDPTTKRLRYLPFHGDLVHLIADTTFRITFQVLADPRTDELISDMIRENVDQIRAAVSGRYHEEGPAAPMDISKTKSV
ncbi:ion transporter [Skermania sp. ID1734]|uniref:ion transporter n=1 Tax=Skermania sp. ID1734 TaxID=2597516 RepID=UPI00163DE148|nr:ion transporter [Skermania sp. ID1734]